MKRDLDPYSPAGCEHMRSRPCLQCRWYRCEAWCDEHHDDPKMGVRAAIGLAIFAAGAWWIGLAITAATTPPSPSSPPQGLHVPEQPIELIFR